MFVNACYTYKLKNLFELIRPQQTHIDFNGILVTVTNDK